MRPAISEMTQSFSEFQRSKKQTLVEAIPSISNLTVRFSHAPLFTGIHRYRATFAGIPSSSADLLRHV
jgi:hypothetical protein